MVAPGNGGLIPEYLRLRVSQRNSQLVEENLSTTEDKVPKFSVGDKVKITKTKTIFEKGYTQGGPKNYSQFSKIQNTDSPTYKITDYNG